MWGGVFSVPVSPLGFAYVAAVSLGIVFLEGFGPLPWAFLTWPEPQLTLQGGGLLDISGTFTSSVFLTLVI